jgi:hypothetical protein
MTNETLNTVLTAVIVPILVALAPFIVIYLSKLSEEVKGRINDKALNKYIDIANDAVSTSVVAVMQTYVDALKGTDQWTPDKQHKAFEEAENRAILIMGSAAREALKEVYGDLDVWMASKIEYYVNTYKASAAIAA